MAFDRRVEISEGIAAVEPPDGPLRGLRIIRAEADTTIFAAWQLDHVVVHVGPAVHEREVVAGSFEFHPFVIVGQPLLLAAVIDLPLADEEIEIVQAGQVRGLHGLRIVLGGARGSDGADGGEDGDGEKDAEIAWIFHGNRDARAEAAAQQ